MERPGLTGAPKTPSAGGGESGDRPPPAPAGPAFWGPPPRRERGDARGADACTPRSRGTSGGPPFRGPRTSGRRKGGSGPGPRGAPRWRDGTGSPAARGRGHPQGFWGHKGGRAGHGDTGKDKTGGDRFWGASQPGFPEESGVDWGANRRRRGNGGQAPGFPRRKSRANRPRPGLRNPEGPGAKGVPTSGKRQSAKGNQGPKTGGYQPPLWGTERERTGRHHQRGGGPGKADGEQFPPGPGRGRGG